MEPRVLKSLLKTAAYPEPTAAVDLVQTHVSYIFLTDRFVYKVKKVVDFGFLNFSTLDRRRFYCEEEVRLNSRLSPDLYAGVVEVRESGGAASFSGPGKIIDYAVKMKRLPEDRMLHRLVDAGKATPSDMSRLAGVVARFHLKAATSEEIARFGSPDVIYGNWEENFRLAKEFVGTVLSADDLELVEKWVKAFLRENDHLFLERIREGKIRDCDGDLHMQNICIVGDRIYIFDCIEFNDRFRFSDTAADVAFLAMDLDYHEREDLSAVFLASYQEESSDNSFRPLLNFYKCYRAFVRGKVESLKARDPVIEAGERKMAYQEAVKHFRLARRYAVAANWPRSLIVMCGLMGTGKSYIARNLGFDLGMPVIRTDVVRKELFDVTGEPASREFKGGIYSPDATEETYRTALLQADRYLREGRSVIVDGTFITERLRQPFRDLAQNLGADFHILRCVCPEKIVKKRLIAREEAGIDISDGRWELYHQQERDFSPPAADDPAVQIVDSTRSEAEITATVLRRMGVMS